MAREKGMKRKQPTDAPSPRDEGERRGRRDKRPMEEKLAPPLPSQIKNKEKRSEVHAKVKREKKAQKPRLARELGQASQRAAELGEQLAVVKRSADPYEDFRKSMEEMIAEWPEGGDGEGEHSAEGLLETYLVLNSPRHYPAILAAFADVRETLCP